MNTPRQDRIRQLRAELRKLEDEEDAPPITREDLKKMTPAEINRRADAGELDHLLRGESGQPA